MIFQCNCGQRYEISGLQEDTEFEGKEFECTNCMNTVRIPKLGGTQLIDKASTEVICQNCGQKYEPDYRPGTRLICRCGNVLFFPSTEPKPGEDLGRRREDKVPPVKEDLKGKWKVRISGVEYAPIDFNTLRQWFEERRVEKGDYITRAGIEDWMCIGNVNKLVKNIDRAYTKYLKCEKKKEKIERKKLAEFQAVQSTPVTTVASPGSVVQPRVAATGKPICQQCGAEMRKAKETKSSGTGCILIILGLVLTPILIGIPILIYGLSVQGKRRGLWVCKKCGYQIERKLGRFEFG